MNRQISFRQYRTIDLTILLVILAVCQFLIFMATRFWYPEQLYVVSPIAGMVALVMMRWNGFAWIHAVFGGIFFTLLAGGTWEQMAIYGIGNLASLLVMAMFKLFGKERVRQDAFLSLVFAFLVQLLMWLGRAGVAALFDYEVAACIGFITTDILSGLFTLFILWIVRRTDGLFEDQKHYLLRIESERQVERGEQF